MQCKFCGQEIKFCKIYRECWKKGVFLNTEEKKIEKRWFSLSSLKKLIKKLVRVDDSPKRIARGLAIGVFWGILPTFGLAILFALPTAIFLRANKFSTILGLFVANPFTTPFIYAFEYKIGELILRVAHRCFLEALAIRKSTKVS